MDTVGRKGLEARHCVNLNNLTGWGHGLSLQGVILLITTNEPDRRVSSRRIKILRPMRVHEMKSDTQPKLLYSISPGRVTRTSPINVLNKSIDNRTSVMGHAAVASQIGSNPLKMHSSIPLTSIVGSFAPSWGAK